MSSVLGFTSEWDGLRVTVMGLGVLGGGVGAARYLASHGARVTVTDMRDSEALADSMAQLAALPITYHLGGHDLADFTADRADVVVRNPGVPMDSPYLVAARESGVRIEMEMSIFFRDCPSRIIGITGTKGKTTVSELLGTILRTWNPESLLAGNMGISAIGALDGLTPSTPVALELSSFQIESLNDHALSPSVAVFTNIFPDHLDRYRDFDHYANTKRQMATSMSEDDVVVFNDDDSEAAMVGDMTNARLLPFGLEERAGDAAWLSGNDLVIRFNDVIQHYPRPNILSLSGDHGARNALAALAAATAYGVPAAAIRDGLAAFKGVENRLQLVMHRDGVRWINDTSATAPEAAIAGVRVMAPADGTLHVIAGGADKRTDLSPFADELARHRTRAWLLEGTATPGLRDLLDQCGVAVAGTFGSMQDAVAEVGREARTGDVVALCPACASFGMFRNEFDRGRQFIEAVNSLAATEDHENA